jgi:hypothetical protein
MMRELCRLIWRAFVGLFRSRAALEAEILVLRHQLNVLRRESLLKAREAVERQIADLDPKVMRLAPGVGAIAPGFAMLRKSKLHTLIHQRHLTPSCGGRAPTR